MKINPGVLLMLLTALFQSTMQAVVKSVSTDINTSIQLLAYYGIPLIIFIPIIAKQGIAPYKTKRFSLLLLRGFITSAAVFCFFYTATHMDLGIGAVLFNTTPIFIPLLALIFLKERTDFIVIFGIAVSLIGVIIVIHPKPGEFISYFSLIGVASGLLMAVSQVMLRYLVKMNENVNNIVFYLYLNCIISTILFISVEYIINHQSPLHFSNHNSLLFVYGMLLLLGFLSFFAQRIMTIAFRYMPAAKLAPYLYMSVPISSIYGWIFWKQNLNYVVLLGSLLVVSGVCIITFGNKLFRKSIVYNTI